ncbi:hypothetical protein QFC22_006338 [Naganishia vaughanmartiniae]|uniref:Uncharacterized protein n=1 Tax=Naganishia vaughanmartiniae TaxID=1424756 RepID=A0ACC2WKI9_9TREE|nr:hypothetical protein QFC22_006338 [Naganishia vaughanmartiniae]
MSKRQRVSSAATDASYNGFQPVPIRVQDTSATSSNKKANGANGKGKGKAGDVSSALHYLWIRQHRAPKSPATSTTSSETLPSNRTLFVANLPVDTTERDVRLMFGTYGGIDRVEFKVGEIGRMGREGDPWWTVEDEEEEDANDDDSEGGDEEDSEEEEQDDAAMSEEDDTTKDAADPTMTKRQRRRITRKQERADPEFAITALRKKAPHVVPLPPLNPRSSANGQGYLAPCSGCYVVYLDELSVSRCLQLAGGKSGVKIWERAAASSKSSVDEEPTGLTYYRRLHTLLRPSLEIVKRHADTSIALFDWHANLSSERAKRGAITDDDGFTLVVRGGKFGRTAGKGEKGVAVASRRFMLDSKKAVKKAVVVASAEERGVTGDDADMLDAREGLTRGKKRKTQQLEGFYKFQRDEQRRSHLANIRANFEADKAKVETLKAAKRFKPY